ncbi:hypothetical protein D3C72_904450 [compost metagenome]
MLKTEVLQQADRDLVLLRQQRLLEGALPVFFGAEPLARAAMPGSPGRGRLFRHCPGQWLEDPQPLDGVFPRLNEAAHVLQRVQPLRALTRTEKMLAQAGVEAWQMNQHLPDLNQLRRQGVEQLVLQIIEQCRRTPLLTRPRTTIEQCDPHASAPATTALSHPFGGLCRQARLDMTEQLPDLGLGKRQRPAFALVQLIIEQQPRPVAGWSSTGAQPPGQRRAGDGQQAIEHPVEFRIGCSTVIIDKQPGRCL